MRLDETFDEIFNSFSDDYLILNEAAKDKINKIEKVIGEPLDNMTKVVINKKENEFNWNDLLKTG